ncbi:unnamed protein product [Caenorhabditis nigoni]
MENQSMGESAALRMSTIFTTKTKRSRNPSVYSLTPVFTDLQSALICFAVAYSIVVVLGLLIRDVEWESDTCDFKLKKFDQNVRTLLEDQESSAKIVKDTLLRRANSLPNFNVIRVDVGSIQSVCEAGRAEATAEMPARSKSMALFENKNQLPVIQEYSISRACSPSNLYRFLLNQ